MRIRFVGETLQIIDPNPKDAELLQFIYPNFTIMSEELPGFNRPGFLSLREAGCGVCELSDIPEEMLWDIHSNIMHEFRSGNLRPKQHDQASVLDLKIELAWRMLSHCKLCSQNCGVDRTKGELGVCKLGTKAKVANAFVHIAEETPVNPSFLLSLAGCGLRCRYCQQSGLLDPASVEGRCLKPGIWDELPIEGARSLSFIGGNPDESLYAILRFLRAAPEDWALPIVWNCNAFSTPATLELLDGVVDVYLPDFKYWNPECSKKLSSTPKYPAVAKQAIRMMLAQGAPVIVRILILPGHTECCHLPVLDYLATLEGQLMVSIRDQYYPDWQITANDGEMMKRVTAEEVEAVQSKVKELDLTLL